ncbi:hypothetical protein F5Y03DRAFT_148424 [Xylaria venustula]|nr:hypothetical protein F5Y03DRAFT_148424 [Xylaria venustula]
MGVVKQEQRVSDTTGLYCCLGDGENPRYDARRAAERRGSTGLSEVDSETSFTQSCSRCPSKTFLVSILFFSFLFLCVTRISCTCSGVRYCRVSFACFGNYSLALQVIGTICPTTTPWGRLSKQTHTRLAHITMSYR